MRTSMLVLFGAVLGIVLLVPSPASSESQAPTSWSDLRQVCAEAGIDSKSVDDIIHRCREQGVSVPEAYSMLSSGCQATAEGLPSKPVMEKIREGLAKGIPPARIAEAARQRLGHLISAAEIAESIDPKLRVSAVITPAAQAMESGLAPAATMSLMEAGGTRSAKELAIAFEACEALNLAGFSSDEAGRIVVDCMNRNLRRVEFRRVVRYASQQRQRGMETPAIRQSLWGNGVEDPQQQNRHREQHEQGPRGGRGPEGPGHGGGHGNP